MKIRSKKFLVFFIFSLFATGQMVQAWPNLNSIPHYTKLNLSSYFNNKITNKFLIPIGAMALTGLIAYSLFKWFNKPINSPLFKPINTVTELPHPLEILFQPPIRKDLLALKDIYDQTVVVEKEIAMLCEVIKTGLRLSPSTTIKLPCTRTDIAILTELLKLFVNPALTPQEKEGSIKAILHEYSTETLIEILATSQKLQPPAEFFKIILEYATTRIFDIHQLDFLSNEKVCSLLKNPNLKKALLIQYQEKVPKASWVYDWFRRLLNQLTIEQALFLLYVDHCLKTRPKSPIRIEYINKKLLIASYSLPDNYIQLLPENLKLHINKFKNSGVR